MRIGALLLLVTIGACSSSPAETGATGPCAAYDAIVAASDYSSSAVGAVGIGGAGAMRAAADLGRDPALAWSNGRAFFVARDSADVFELDAKCGNAIARTSAGAGSNPQDVAVAPDGALWIARYNVASLLVAGADGGAPATIDLSSYDGDGNPNASSIRIIDGKAYVALERLDDNDMYRSKQPSMVVVVDTASRAVSRAITLAGRNPFALMVESGGALWLGEPGNFDDAGESDAGVERLDLATGTSALLVRETDLGGSVAEIAALGACGVAIVADATANVNATSLATFDTASGAVLARGVLATAGFDLQALAFVKDAAGNRALLVGDRRQTGGGYAVHVFDVSDACALTERPKPLLVPQKPVALRPTR